MALRDQIKDADDAALKYELEFYNRLLSQHDEHIKSSNITLIAASDNHPFPGSLGNSQKMDLKVTRDYSAKHSRSIVVRPVANAPSKQSLIRTNSNCRTVIHNRNSLVSNTSFSRLQKSSINSPSLHKPPLLKQKYNTSQQALLSKGNSFRIVPNVLAQKANTACNKTIVINDVKTNLINKQSCVGNVVKSKAKNDLLLSKEMETKSQKLMSDIMAITQRLKQQSKTISLSSGLINSSAASKKNERRIVKLPKLGAKTNILPLCTKTASVKKELDAFDKAKVVAVNVIESSLKTPPIPTQELRASQSTKNYLPSATNSTLFHPNEVKADIVDDGVILSKSVLLEKQIQLCKKDEDEENVNKLLISECSIVPKVPQRKVKLLKKSPGISKKPLVGKKLIASKYKIINEKTAGIRMVTFRNQPRKGTVRQSPIQKNLSHKWISLNVSAKNKTPSIGNKLNSKYKVINGIHSSTAKLKISPSSKFLKKGIMLRKEPNSYRYVKDTKNLQFIRKDKSATKLKSIPMNMLTPNKNLFSKPKINHSGSMKKSSRKHSLCTRSKYKFINRSSNCVQSAKKMKLNTPKLKDIHNASMDIDLLLELAAQKNSSEKGCSASPFEKPMLLKRIYKTNRTLINKNTCSAQAKVAKMIKIKYSALNKKHLWQKQGISRKMSSPKFFKGHPFNSNFQRRVYNAPFYNQRIKRNTSRSKVYPLRHTTSYSRVTSKHIFNFRNKYVSFGSLQKFKTPKKIVTRQNIFVRTPVNVMKSTPVSKILASRVLHRSINRVLTASVKKKMSKVNTYCMFYNRFGRCNKGIKCPYVHDPSKIAICTRFLRGHCKTENCPFSHEICPGKMAICSFYLLGSCTKAECPYRHETLSPDAKMCKAFVKGYCPNGKQCKKAHILVCPQYIQGTCDKGKACAFPHPPQKEKKNISIENTKTENPKEIEDDLLMERVSRYFQPLNELEFRNEEAGSSAVVPKRQTLSEQPSFIALNS